MPPFRTSLFREIVSSAIKSTTTLAREKAGSGSSSQERQRKAKAVVGDGVTLRRVMLSNYGNRAKLSRSCFCAARKKGACLSN